jgi:NTP pyrophosphatase (non-canonical NTP hydrolase)
MNIEELKKKSHEIAVEKGFWNDFEIANNQKSEKDSQIFRDLFISQKLLLMISELTESMESLRKSRTYQGDSNLIKELCEQSEENKNLFQMRFIHHVKDTFEDELADTFIRLADLCEKMNIDIESFIKMKMVFNSMRPEKHDKNF